MIPLPTFPPNASFRYTQVAKAVEAALIRSGANPATIPAQVLTTLAEVVSSDARAEQADYNRCDDARQCAGYRARIETLICLAAELVAMSNEQLREAA
jgi:hypothetical protein